MMGDNDDALAPGIVVLVLAASEISIPTWQRHATKTLLPGLQEAFSDLDGSNDIKTLAHGNTTDSARIVEISYPTRTQHSLSECTAAGKSARLTAAQMESGLQYVIQPSSLHALHRQPGLAVFDMDSTLIQQEVIDELARAVGLYPQVAAITDAAMRGEAPYTDFEASLRARVALLKGVPTSTWAQLKTSVITFMPGARELIRTLRALGWKTAVASGGFVTLATWVKDTLGMDYMFANHLVADEEQGILTGELEAGKPIVHADKKRAILLELAAKEGIPLERTLAVGDGSNDLLMMYAAGLGVAFHAKPKVQQAAPARLNTPSLMDVMFILGYSEAELEDIAARTAG